MKTLPPLEVFRIVPFSPAIHVIILFYIKYKSVFINKNINIYDDSGNYIESI